ncbi:hypothetical protein [Nevskia sp.]|uniref:hypothetical protein n=1 Tax=Nevskia sp. TaxID=1929292 RepID=UPI003F6EAD05
MSNERITKDRRSYSIIGLLSAGSRFYNDEYTEDDAVADYLALHPEAVEADVRAELAAELAKLR